MTDTTKLIESLRAVTFPHKDDERYTPHAEEVARLCWAAADRFLAVLDQRDAAEKEAARLTAENERLREGLADAKDTLKLYYQNVVYDDMTSAPNQAAKSYHKIEEALAAQPSDAEVSDG